MADQQQTALTYSPAQFDFVKQKPVNATAAWSGSRGAEGNSTEGSSHEQQRGSKSSDSQKAPVRLPDAPLPIRKMPVPSAQPAKALPALNIARAPGHPAPILKEQPALPLRPASSFSNPPWKRAFRPDPMLTKKDDPPLLSRLANLTKATAPPVTGTHVAGVVPPHSSYHCQQEGLTPQPAAQAHQAHVDQPTTETSPADVLSHSQHSPRAKGLLPSQTSPSHAYQCSAPSLHARSQADPNGLSVKEAKAESVLDQFCRGAQAETPAAQPTPPAHPPEPEAKPKSTLRSRLCLQRPAAPVSPAPAVAHPHSSDIAATAAQSTDGAGHSQGSDSGKALGNSAASEPGGLFSAPGWASAAGTPSAEHSMPARQVRGQHFHTGSSAVQQSRQSTEDGKAGKDAFSTPQVGWRTQAQSKPASAPKGTGAQASQRRSRTQKQSAPRQMKRLYSECSQEEDPQQLMTPDELAAQQERAREDAEDSALIVDYTGTLAKSKQLPGHQGTTQRPSSLNGPASTSLHTQSAPKQQPSRRDGLGNSWANPARFSTGTARVSPHPLRAMHFIIDIDDDDNDDDSVRAAMLTSKRSGRQQCGPALNIDIDENEDSALAMPAGKPHHGKPHHSKPHDGKSRDSKPHDGKHSGPPSCGLPLKFDIDDDEDAVPTESTAVEQNGAERSGPLLKFDIDEDDMPVHQQQQSGPSLRFDIDDDDAVDETAEAADDSLLGHREPMLNQPAAQAAFSIDIDDTLGCENPAAGNTGHQPHSPFDHACIAHSHSHQHHAQQPLSHATAPQLKFDIDIDDSDDDEIQPLGGTAQLEDRKASHQYASTSTAAPATAGTRAHADAQPDSAQLQSAPQLWASAQSAPQLWASAQSAIAPHLGFQAASTARSAGLQQPPVAKRLTSFKPPRRVMPAAPAKSAGIEAHGSDNGTSVKPAAAAAANGHEAGMEAEREGGGTAALTAQPLKRLRKAGQATPAPPQPPLKLKGGPDDGDADAEEERELQQALWLSSQQQQPYDMDAQGLQQDDRPDQGSPLLPYNQQNRQGQDREEEEHKSKAVNGSTSSLPGWNIAQHLLLQQQQSKEEDGSAQGKAGNPFARAKAKGKASLTAVPRSIDSSARASAISAEALKAVLQPPPKSCTDLWQKRLHKGSNDVATASKGQGRGSTPAGSALGSRPTGRTQPSTSPGTFVLASSLGSHAASSQSPAGHAGHDVSISRHGASVTHQGRRRQTAEERYGRFRRQRAEESEVIDLVEIPGKAPSSSRHADESAMTDDAALGEEDEEGPADGPPWWERFPDFVPLSALKWGTNPRDGATVHINYKAQFSEQASSKGRKKAASRVDHGQDDADDDCETLDMDDEEGGQMQAGRSRSSKGRKSSTSGRGAREGEVEEAEGSHGRWVHHNNYKVYIDADGRMLTGSRAYQQAQRDKGAASHVQPGRSKRKSHKSPGKGKRKRKFKATGSKLPKFRATKSRFG